MIASDGTIDLGGRVGVVFFKMYSKMSTTQPPWIFFDFVYPGILSFGLSEVHEKSYTTISLASLATVASWPCGEVAKR